MQAYTQHQNALLAASQPNGMAWLRDRVAESLFPEAATACNGLGMEKAWHQDEWAGGGWVSPKRNQFLQGFHVWGRPEGRIHFAGCSTSLLAGWMQGAIEAGQRAACEVSAAL